MYKIFMVLLLCVYTILAVLQLFVNQCVDAFA